MNAGLIYLLTVVLPNIHSSFAPLAVVTFIGTFTCLIVSTIASVCAASGDDDAKALYKITCSSTYGLGFFALLFTLMYDASPDEKQMYMAAGAYAVTNTKDIAKLPDNVVNVANTWLEKAAASAGTATKQVTDTAKATTEAVKSVTKKQ